MAMSGAPIIPRCQRESESSLSFAQERLWFLEALGAGGSYCIPIALKLSGRIESTALKEGLDAIVARHEAMRTTFPAPGGQPMAMVARSQALQLPIVSVAPGEALEAA